MSSLVSIKDELLKVERNYKTASKLTSVNSLKKFLSNLVKEKNNCIQELPQSTSQIEGISDLISLNFQDATMKTETILVRCMNEEERLIRLYQKSLSVEHISADERKIFQKQLNEALITFNQLRAIKQARNYR